MSTNMFLKIPDFVSENTGWVGISLIYILLELWLSPFWMGCNHWLMPPCYILSLDFDYRQTDRHVIVLQSLRDWSGPMIDSTMHSSNMQWVSHLLLKHTYMFFSNADNINKMLHLASMLLSFFLWYFSCFYGSF